MAEALKGVQTHAIDLTIVDGRRAELILILGVSFAAGPLHEAHEQQSLRYSIEKAFLPRGRLFFAWTVWNPRSLVSGFLESWTRYAA
jgi:hypothetical protein